MPAFQICKIGVSFVLVGLIVEDFTRNRRRHHRLDHQVLKRGLAALRPRAPHHVTDLRRRKREEDVVREAEEQQRCMFYNCVVQMGRVRTLDKHQVYYAFKLSLFTFLGRSESGL